MILVEIATRSYLSAVSVLAGFEDYNCQPSLDLCLFNPAVPLKQDNGDGMRMDLMWRPPLPEITAGKADTDCPSQVDYCEVRPVCRCQRGLLGTSKRSCDKSRCISGQTFETIRRVFVPHLSSLRSVGVITSP